MNQYHAVPVLTRRRFLAGIAGVTIVSLVAACGGESPSTSHAAGAGTGGASTGAALPVVAAESFWGSIATQLGGDRVAVTSIITNPNTDPHDYEPRPDDARTVADARYVILNGAGYDPWLEKLLEASPSDRRMVLNVGELAGKKSGDNPHLWYDPAIVDATIARITSDLTTLVPGDSAFFAQRQSQFTGTDLKPYHDLITAIKQSFAGTPIGCTESIFVPMASALGLDLISPVGFMDAISEGNDVSAADKATFDQQIKEGQIKVLVYNQQNATPDTEALNERATKANIPVVAITETLDPATATFEAWQVRQLTDLKLALERAAGR